MAIKAALKQRLERLQNRRTRYEIVVGCPETGQRFLVCYADRWTGVSVTRMVANKAKILQAVTGVDPDSWCWGKRRSDPIPGRDAKGNLWLIRKSGRTQREAYISGELPWIEEEAAREA